MKLGFMTGYDEGMFKFAKETGFQCIELCLGREGETTARTVAESQAKRVLDVCGENGLEISALGFYANFLDPDEAKRKENIEQLTATIDAAAALEVKTVCSFAGRDPEKSIPDNIPIFRDVWRPIVRHAESKNVRIAFENCPMMHGHPFRGINLAMSPEAWEGMFNAIDTPAIGLEYDPSHLYWLQVDYLQVIYDFGDKIYHVHAKDTEIMQDVLAEVGIYGIGWWRYRIPGWGEVNWDKVFAALADVGYNGNVDIEHEDPVFHGDRFKEGLARGYNTLAKYFVKV